MIIQNQIDLGATQVFQKARTEKINSIKAEEPEGGGTALPAGLLSTGTVCHLQSHQYLTSVH